MMEVMDGVESDWLAFALESSGFPAGCRGTVVYVTTCAGIARGSPYLLTLDHALNEQFTSILGRASKEREDMFLQLCDGFLW